MTEALRCFLQIRDLPLAIYALPGDGRKAKIVRSKRLLLAWKLASAANPDGTGITIGVDHLCADWLSRREVFRLLDDLQTLGFLENGKLTKWNGTRQRTLNVRRMLAAAVQIGAASSAKQRDVEVPDAGAVGVQNNTDRSAIQHTLGVQNSTSVVPKPADFGTLPLPTVNQPFQPSTADGGKVSLEEWKAQLPEPLRSAPFYKQKKQAQEFLSTEGPVATAIATVACRERNWAGVNQHWMLFLREVENFRQSALESTPEGQAAKQRDEESVQKAALDFARKIAQEQLAEAEARNREMSEEEVAAFLNKSAGMA